DLMDLAGLMDDSDDSDAEAAIAPPPESDEPPAESAETRPESGDAATPTADADGDALRRIDDDLIDSRDDGGTGLLHHVGAAAPTEPVDGAPDEQGVSDVDSPSAVEPALPGLVDEAADVDDAAPRDDAQ